MHRIFVQTPIDQCKETSQTTEAVRGRRRGQHRPGRPNYRTEVALCPVLIRGSGSCAADNRGSGRYMFSPTMVDAKRSAVAEALLPTVVAFALHELLRLFLL